MFAGIHPKVCHIRGIPHDNLNARYHTANTESGDRLKVLHIIQCSGDILSFLNNGSCKRMFGTALNRGCKFYRLLFRYSSDGNEVGHYRFSYRKRARLIKSNGGNAIGFFKCLPALKNDAELCRASYPNDKRCRCRQTHSTGT